MVYRSTYDSYIVGEWRNQAIYLNDIKVISNKFTKIGKTILDKYPNLEWIYIVVMEPME